MEKDIEFQINSINVYSLQEEEKFQTSISVDFQNIDDAVSLAQELIQFVQHDFPQFIHYKKQMQEEHQKFTEV